MRGVCTMMKTLLPFALALVALAAVGCGSGGDSGDVEAAKKAAAAVPKKVEDLPANMPPEARRGAEAGIKQAAEMEKMQQQQEAARKAATGK